MTTDKIDLVAAAEANEKDSFRMLMEAEGDLKGVLNAVAALLALSTPMSADTNDEYRNGWDSGWNAYRREARKIFGVED